MLIRLHQLLFFFQIYILHTLDCCRALKIYKPTKITLIEAIHHDSAVSDDVCGFYSENNILYYFPQNLVKFFKNLELI